MFELRDDPNYEDVKTSNIMVALHAAMQIQKKKVVVGPNDSVGVMFFNTVKLLARLSTLNAIHSMICIVHRAEVVTGRTKVLRSNAGILFFSPYPPLVHRKFKNLSNCWTVNGKHIQPLSPTIVTI